MNFRLLWFATQNDFFPLKSIYYTGKNTSSLKLLDLLLIQKFVYFQRNGLRIESRFVGVKSSFQLFLKALNALICNRSSSNAPFKPFKILITVISACHFGHWFHLLNIPLLYSFSIRISCRIYAYL